MQAPQRGRTGLMPPQSRSPTAKKLSIYATQLMKSRDSSRSSSQTANCLQLPRTAGVHLMSRVLTVVMVVAAQSAVQPSALGFPHRSPTRKSTRTQPTEALVLPTFWIVKMLTAAGRPCQDSTCGPLRRCQSSHTGSNVLQGLISTFMRCFVHILCKRACALDLAPAAGGRRAAGPSRGGACSVSALAAGRSRPAAERGWSSAHARLQPGR